MLLNASENSIFDDDADTSRRLCELKVLGPCEVVESLILVLLMSRGVAATWHEGPSLDDPWSTGQNSGRKGDAIHLPPIMHALL